MTPNDEMVERVKDSILDCLVSPKRIGNTGQMVMDMLGLTEIARLQTDRLANRLANVIAPDVVAAMKDSDVYQAGFAAGQASVAVTRDDLAEAVKGMDVVAQIMLDDTFDRGYRAGMKADVKDARDKGYAKGVADGEKRSPKLDGADDLTDIHLYTNAATHEWNCIVTGWDGSKWESDWAYGPQTALHAAIAAAREKGGQAE